MKPLKILSNHLKSLGKAWQPDYGKQSVPKIWDANRRQYNLHFFAKHPYVGIVGDKDRVWYLLQEFNDEHGAYCYSKYFVGLGYLQILDLKTGEVICEKEPREPR